MLTSSLGTTGVIDFSRIQPHVGQVRVIKSVRDNELTIHSPGRRWGKSSCRRYVIVDQLSRGKGFVEGACGAQSHSEAANVWETDLDLFSRANMVLDAKNDEQRRFIDFKAIRRRLPNGETNTNGGGRVWYPSLAPDCHALFQGHGLFFAIIDEFSHVPYDAWEETISPMLADAGGHALIIGSPIPSGINFAGFSDLWEQGNPKSDTFVDGYFSMTGRSEENPYVSADAIAKKRARLIKRGRAALAACLYDGKFVTDLGAVFTNLDSVFTIHATEVEPDCWIWRLPRAGEAIVIGIDFGRHDDATVVSVFSRDTLEQIGLLRLERTEYLVQLPLIDKFVRRFGRCQLWAEGREEAAAELLRQRFKDVCNLVKWSTGGQFDKNTSVARGMDYCERAAWRMIDVKWQREEFRKYAREKTPSGRWKYEAAEGAHDDSVAASLYATYGLPLEAKSVTTKEAVPPPLLPNTERFSPRRYLGKVVDDQPFVLRRSG